MEFIGESAVFIGIVVPFLLEFVKARVELSPKQIRSIVAIAALLGVGISALIDSSWDVTSLIVNFGTVFAVSETVYQYLIQVVTAKK